MKKIINNILILFLIVYFNEFFYCSTWRDKFDSEEFIAFVEGKGQGPKNMEKLMKCLRSKYSITEYTHEKFGDVEGCLDEASTEEDNEYEYTKDDIKLAKNSFAEKSAQYMKFRSKSATNSYKSVESNLQPFNDDKCDQSNIIKFNGENIDKLSFEYLKAYINLFFNTFNYQKNFCELYKLQSQNNSDDLDIINIKKSIKFHMYNNLENILQITNSPILSEDHLHNKKESCGKWKRESRILTDLWNKNHLEEAKRRFIRELKNDNIDNKEEIEKLLAMLNVLITNNVD